MDGVNILSFLRGFDRDGDAKLSPTEVAHGATALSAATGTDYQKTVSIAQKSLNSREVANDKPLLGEFSGVSQNAMDEAAEVTGKIFVFNTKTRGDEDSSDFVTANHYGNASESLLKNRLSVFA